MSKPKHTPKEARKLVKELTRALRNVVLEAKNEHTPYFPKNERIWNRRMERAEELIAKAEGRSND